MTNPIDVVLGRLDGVARSGNSFKALCPVHGDKTPSLSVKEGDDGRVLLHCFSGCRVEEIIAAMGLNMSDLFADGKTQRHGSKIAGVSLRELNAAIEHERQILYIVKADQKAGKLVSQLDLERAKTALKRISMAGRVL